jgi:hypothetical protein
MEEEEMVYQEKIEKVEDEEKGPRMRKVRKGGDGNGDKEMI